jgi:hypothetical protein
MPVGIEIIGGPSLTSDSKVMQVVQKVSSASMSSASTSFGRVLWTATVGFTGCVLALSPTPGNLVPINIGSRTESGGSTTVQILAGSSGASFDLFAFKPGGGGAVSSGAGLEIYNIDGSLGFGSNYKALRPLTQFEWRYDVNASSGAFSADDYALSYPGKRVGCIVSRHARALDGDGTLITTPTPVLAPYFSNNTGTGDARLSWLQVATAGKDLPYWERPGRYMFIDVTNF